jgi:hypothetical protein
MGISIPNPPAIVQLSSNPGAPATVSLWFADPDPTHNNQPYTDAAGQYETWSRVSEAFSPFNVNVTTEHLDTLAGKVQVEIISGSNAWSGRAVGGFANTAAFVGGDGPAYVFPENLSNNPRYIGDAAIHEAGHTFDLNHQRRFDASGNLVEEYNTGDGSIAPFMGNSYSAPLGGRWWKGTTLNNFDQDDLAVISGATNGFGYRPQDHGQDISHADTLTGLGTGVIETTADRDTFHFQSTGGTISAALMVGAYGPTLHGKLELDNANGSPIAIAADPNTLGQYLTLTVAPGDYYLVAQSFGAYGDVGQYTVTVTPEPSVGLFLLGALAMRRRR